jgi:hypothetical protein
MGGYLEFQVPEYDHFAHAPVQHFIFFYFFFFFFCKKRRHPRRPFLGAATPPKFSYIRQAEAGSTRSMEGDTTSAQELTEVVTADAMHLRCRAVRVLHSIPYGGGDVAAALADTSTPPRRVDSPHGEASERIGKEISGQDRAIHRSGTTTRSIAIRFRGKDRRMRRAMMGTRKTTIRDHHICVDEVGVSYLIAAESAPDSLQHRPQGDTTEPVCLRPPADKKIATAQGRQ